jgi:8-oxo-dGTP pyrophosphatase MutT (NUDIX family)
VASPLRSEVVRAAGGVLRRVGDSGPEVLLVHRPRYDDWTFPKGKAEPGETDEECARREVEEETGVRTRLGRELPSVRWRDAEDRPKIARYWLLEPEDPAATAEARNEIDGVEWLSPQEARRRLSYDRDREVLRAAVDDGKTATR